jgi:TetR/AcrR family transcriptional regulator, tetracycline repressor protein
MEEIRDYLAALPVDRFPNVAALAGPMMNQETDGFDRFELGLEIILRGLAAFTEAGAPASAPEPPAAAGPSAGE